MTKLWLNGNNIGHAGAVSLAEGLKHNGALKTLWLGDNQIGDDGAKALAESGFGALTELSLEANEIGDVGAAALADALKVNTALKTVHLSDNKISADGKQALRDAWTTSGRDLKDRGLDL